jgi:hypothetical protein
LRDIEGSFSALALILSSKLELFSVADDLITTQCVVVRNQKLILKQWARSQDFSVHNWSQWV